MTLLTTKINKNTKLISLTQSILPYPLKHYAVKTYERSGDNIARILTSELDWGDCSDSRTGDLSPGKVPPSPLHWI
jgi:hypothetical protein